ncbi:ribosomal RNA-processing protein 7-domain-containing protein [Neohortaea acidophila]|uniref:Ribosomal RNA-processing protein 7-domain-containing protein n=1 Tax=Neohortaea acidophila TaxID=245834 RepID=A0A6A6PU90_9PEZI|nr:ribosomal RNA-processing protein 7-domain-containing protein [Neohortaea acidophila]KAF2483552.1 ribosomal RNA-processing protein 7-domain-containing protein [Neohortaea acidophila]
MASIKQKSATQVQDFAVLPLATPATQSYPSNTTHYLYLRPNAPRAPTEDTPRELFLVNVPVDTTETHLRSLFADQLGGARVEDVEFEHARLGKGIKAPVVQTIGKKGRKRKRDSEGAVVESNGEEVGLLPEVWERELHPSGATAVVRFVDRASASLALKEARRVARAGRRVPWGTEAVEARVPALGSERYLSHHRLRFPDVAALRGSVDAFMAAFSAQEAERARAFARQRSAPDEDGFVTVTRGGRKGPAREAETKAKEEELKKREKSRIKEDFYRFQVREKKKENARDLVRGFEEDRRRVEEMRKRKGRVRPEG